MIIKPEKIIRDTNSITVYCSNGKTYILSNEENRGSIFPRHEWIYVEELQDLSTVDVMQIIAGRLDRE